MMYNLEALYDDGEMVESNNGDEYYADECMSDESGVREADIIYPVIVNETSTVGLRDSGNMSMLIVDESLVPKGEINYNKSVLCSGAFDGQTKRSLPTAIVMVQSPHFGYAGNVRTRAIVTKLPDKVKVIIGNAFFRQNRHLTDVIMSRRAKATKTPYAEPERQNSGIQTENDTRGQPVQRNAPKTNASHAEKARQFQQQPHGKPIGGSEVEQARCQYGRGHNNRPDKLTTGQLDSARDTGHAGSSVTNRMARQTDRDTTRARMTRQSDDLTVLDSDISGQAIMSKVTDIRRNTADSGRVATISDRVNKVITRSNAQPAAGPSDRQMTDNKEQTGSAIRASDAGNEYMTADETAGATTRGRHGRRQAATYDKQLIRSHTDTGPMNGRQRLSMESYITAII